MKTSLIYISNYAPAWTNILARESALYITLNSLCTASQILVRPKQARQLFVLFGQVSTEPATHGAKSSYIFLTKLRLVKSMPFE